MSTCKDCLHYEVCEALENGNGVKKVHPIQCGCFKPKADYAPVVFCDECKHKEVLVPSTAIWCNKHKIYIKPQPTDFCSYGEKESEVQGE